MLFSPSIVFALSPKHLLQEAKSTTDTEKSSWRKLLREFEEEGYTDIFLNGHNHEKKGSVDDDSQDPSFFTGT